MAGSVRRTALATNDMMEGATAEGGSAIVRGVSVKGRWSGGEAATVSLGVNGTHQPPRAAPIDRTRRYTTARLARRPRVERSQEARADRTSSKLLSAVLLFYLFIYLFIIYFALLRMHKYYERSEKR
jgi:hypothetical protein